MRPARSDSPRPSARSRTPHRLHQQTPAEQAENDYVFAIPAHARRAQFRQAAERIGARILGEIGRLGLIRVRLTDQQLRDLSHRMPALEPELDAWVFAPIPAAPSQVAPRDQARIGRGSREFLGVPDNAARGDSVRIAVVDTGLTGGALFEQANIQHHAINPAILPEGEYAGHADAVAALIVGSGEVNGLVPQAELLSIPALDGDGSGSAFAVAEGILAAVDLGADVINLSLGTNVDSLALRSAVAYAAQEGVALIAAAGNEGADTVTYPAQYDEVIAVTAVDANEDHVGFANTGAVDLAAPGYGVVTVWEDDLVAVHGTSVATALISASVAILLAADRSLAPIDAVERLILYANDTGAAGPDKVFGAGIANVERALLADTAGIDDIAVGGIHVAETVSITVQNRGTEPVDSATVRITSDKSEHEHSIEDLAPGASAAIAVEVSPDAMRISATARIDGPDQRPDNNTRTVEQLP